MSSEQEPVFEKCKTCPVLKRYERNIVVLQESIESVTTSYQHGVQESVADAIIGASDRDPDYGEPGVLSRDELISEFIVEQNRLIASLERQAGSLRDKADILQLGCAGIARLRGIKGATEYTLEVCGSSQNDEKATGVVEPVRVRRRYIEED